MQWTVGGVGGVDAEGGSGERGGRGGAEIMGSRRVAACGGRVGGSGEDERPG